MGDCRRLSSILFALFAVKEPGRRLVIIQAGGCMRLKLEEGIGLNHMSLDVRNLVKYNLAH